MLEHAGHLQTRDPTHGAGFPPGEEAERECEMFSNESIAPHSSSMDQVRRCVTSDCLCPGNNTEATNL